MEQKGNLKPAPFALTPPTVESLLAAVALQGARMMYVPIEPVKLVDRPRPSANPALAKANDDISSSAPSTSTGTAPRSEEAQLGARVDSPSSPVRKLREPRGDGRPHNPFAIKPTPVERAKAAAPAPVVPDQNDRPGNRLDLIRAVARKLEAKGTQPKGRISIGYRSKTWQPASPPSPFEQRRQQLQQAIADLTARGVLVMVHDRDAAIRRYRVTGRTELLLAEDVIALAARRAARSPEQGA